MNLVKLGFVKDEEITALLSKQYGVPSINLTQFEIDASVIKLIPAETVQKYQIIPLSRAGATLTIAITDPTNVFAMDDIKFMTGYNVEPVVASETAVTEAIQRYYRRQRPPKAEKKDAAPAEANLHSAATLEMVTKALEDRRLADDDVEVLEELEQIDVASLERQSGEAPVIRLVNLMLMSAIQKGASDIHIEPYEKEFRVRFRIDGILYNVMAPPMKFRDAITSRIKIMSKLDIAEKRLPQDGRIKIRFADGRRDQGDRLPRLVSADAVRRKNRPSSPRQGQVDARHDQAGVRARLADEARGRDRQAVGHGPGHRSDRQRQDQHALLLHRQDQHARKRTS